MGVTTRGTVLRALEKAGICVQPHDIEWAPEWGGYLIDGMDWEDWLEAWTLD